MMLAHLGEKVAAKDIQSAVMKLLADGKIKTPDLGGTSKTHEVGDEVCRLLLDYSGVGEFIQRPVL